MGRIANVFILRPRHHKVLDAIFRYGSCCDNLLWQASGLSSRGCFRVVRELRLAGLVKFVNRRVSGRPPGWHLTPAGRKLAADRDRERTRKLRQLLKTT